MNNQLAILFRMNQNGPAKTRFVIETVLAMDTGMASGRQERAYQRLHPNMISAARAVVREFTSRTGLINLDHVMYQLGIDDLQLYAGEFVDENHECTDRIYVGHYITPGRGAAHKCSTCARVWSKIGDQYSPAEMISV